MRTEGKSVTVESRRSGRKVMMIIVEFWFDCIDILLLQRTSLVLLFNVDGRLMAEFRGRSEETSFLLADFAMETISIILQC